MIYKSLNKVFRSDTRLYFSDSYNNMYIRLEEVFFLYLLTTKDFKIYSYYNNYFRVGVSDENKYIGDKLFRLYKERFDGIHKCK